jgi:glycosyltransferase involved in cell wall biosynthesis
MTISAVVPTFNAARHLPACLEALSAADEVVVADGGSSDGTQAIASGAGARLTEAPRGRGLQLAAGAAAASGDVLLFIHADTRLPPEWRELVRSHVARSSRPACFRFRLDDRSWQARTIERGVALRTRLLGLPYGDQGLGWFRRSSRNLACLSLWKLGVSPDRLAALYDRPLPASSSPAGRAVRAE